MAPAALVSRYSGGVVFVALTVLSAVVAFAFYPSTAQAGILDEIRTFMRGKVSAFVPVSAMSVQTMPLVRPAMNIDPNPAKGGGEVLVEGDGAVVAQGRFVGETVMPEKDAISIYIVPEAGRRGGTLSEIADMFGVTVNTIKWANDLESDVIMPGQVLTILPISGIRHTVEKGETLASIAKEYKGDANEIALFNGITGPLAVGTEVIIPNGQEAFVPEPVQESGSPSAPAPSQASPSYAGYYINPLPGGRRTQGVHGTNGVDLAVPGSARPPIVASAAGDVIIAFEGGWNGGYGSYVVIKHDNGTQTLYAHMSSVNVGRGQRVNQGQVIGYVGSSGRSTGPHLHFEIRGGPRNPF